MGEKRTPVLRAESVYRALRRAIIEQALKPGMKLPEDSIGERLGVSRTLGNGDHEQGKHGARQVHERL